MPRPHKRGGKKSKGISGGFDLTDVLDRTKSVKADAAHKEDKGVTEGLGLEKEERYLVVPSRVVAVITAAIFESLGTFLLILFTSMAIATLAAPFTPVGSRVAGGLAYGFIFAFIHANFSKYSGGHYNPSTSLAVYLGYQFSPNMRGEWFKNGWSKLVWGTIYLFIYVVCQILFSFIGGWAVEMTLGGDSTNLGVPVVGVSTNLGQALFVEVFATMLITMGYFILMMEKTKGHMDSLFLGLGIAGLYMATAAVSGGAFNPVRYMGPAIANLPGFSWNQSWVFIVGPLVGSIAAWGLYELIRVVLVPSRQYVGWVPLIFGPKSKPVYAHYVVDDDNNKLFIRM